MPASFFFKTSRNTTVDKLLFTFSYSRYVASLLRHRADFDDDAPAGSRELHGRWGPIAVLSSTDRGKTFEMMGFDGVGYIDWDTSAKGAASGVDLVLIECGQDLVFGTDDDLVHFVRELR